MVTTADFTTTVLGTSFRVRSSSPQQSAFVIVRSGKVAVQSRLSAEKTAGQSLTNAVLLIQNQQVMVQTQVSQPLIKTPVQDVELVSNEVNKEQVFEDVAVTTVFDALEKQYGVAIQYDRIILGKCLVNTAFNEENLRERLSAVCQAIGATYQVGDEQIRIYSSGCSL